MNANKIIDQGLSLDIKGKSKDEIIKSFYLKNQSIGQKTTLDWYKTHKEAKEVENYDNSLKYTLAYKEALTQNLYNSMNNQNLMTSSNLQLNAAKLLLTKAQAETEPYKRKQLFELAGKLAKETDWMDALNKTKIGTGIGNTGINLLKSFIKKP